MAMAAAPEGVLDEEVHLFDFFGLDKIIGLEIRDFASNARCECVDRKARDLANARAARKQIFPIFFDARSQRGDYT